ncbi:MAG TPA: serine/threonine-protein kinase, partial [Polyangiaceae bacterium]|nr:serine/threonine-protein kinase [Polyangiaceae bacterium]
MASAAKSAAAPLRPEAQGSLPRPFGRLTLLKLLARGGMGEVYLAASGAIEGAERPCVVKLIRRDHADDPSFVARFLDETRVQAQLDHPGVARALEAATTEDGQPYVVVEYIEGSAVSDVRARAVQAGERLSWADAVALASLVAEALAHVHERTDARGNPLNIAHRDLSPQNVMVGFDGGVRLVDFGTARGENRRCHTVAGVVYAKPGYVAPEVANGVPGDAQADLYALGVMLWELCAGRRFLQGDAGEHLAAVGADRRPLPPVAELTGAPPELDEVLARLTAFSTKHRTPSARRALAELKPLLALAGPPDGAQARLAALMDRLYPSEPGRSRAEFERLVGVARRLRAEAMTPRAKTPRAPAADDRLPGTAYRLTRKIDEGAVGVVYEAEHV